MAGSCVSATEWVVGSFVSATVVGKGKDPRIGEVGGVWGISRIGGGSRVVVIKGGLVEALVHFFRKKGGKRGVCFRFREGLSSMMGQEGLSGSESSLSI